MPFNDFGLGMAFGVLLTLVILPIFRWLAGLQRWWPLLLIAFILIGCVVAWWFWGRG